MAESSRFTSDCTVQARVVNFHALGRAGIDDANVGLRTDIIKRLAPMPVAPPRMTTFKFGSVVSKSKIFIMLPLFQSPAAPAKVSARNWALSTGCFTAPPRIQSLIRIRGTTDIPTRRFAAFG
jgi:hypothetical protein